ncbi:Ppx/GppA phosphatase family protein [Crassaminicella profunda]|uniref:Ppx/GppA phosphatase family protein n=1 Tax=Crassaminicella profunda TaxID=1286698 RepID=UPI001CA79BAC|nr:Ppx/GppA phosphatase family protein [Crassaminicella profunda]QZY54728.1 Ppx/GppA family phosphatase [Crassaminicella profunda]
MLNLGAIDIGTNSMRMIIAKIENGIIVKSSKLLNTTRMGENVDQTGSLSNGAMDRNIDALKEFMQIARKEKIKELPIIATSAVRDAKNKDTFIKRVKEEVDVSVEVIDGQREAELGFMGVLRGLKKYDENILVIDIGGGSTEFIFGNEKGIKHLISINIGAVRMTEKFVTTDPVAKKEVENMENTIDEIIKETIDYLCKFKIDKVIGIGGTVTTIAAVSKKMKVYDKDKIHHTNLSHEKVKMILCEFLSLNLEDRKQIDGLQPKRADIIIAGTIILDRILKGLHMEHITISEYDNLEGLIFEQIALKL